MFPLLKPETFEKLRNPEIDGVDLTELIERIWDELPMAGSEFKYGKHGIDVIMQDREPFIKPTIHLQTVDVEMEDGGCYGEVSQWYAKIGTGFAVFNNVNIARKWVDLMIFYREYYGQDLSEEGIVHRNEFQKMGSTGWKTF